MKYMYRPFHFLKNLCYEVRIKATLKSILWDVLFDFYLTVQLF